jgi:hypothetical protein
MINSKLDHPMIAYRAVRGHDKQESFDLMTDLLCHYKGKAFTKALLDNQFISEYDYEKLVKVGRA